MAEAWPRAPVCDPFRCAATLDGEPDYAIVKLVVALVGSLDVVSSRDAVRFFWRAPSRRTAKRPSAGRLPRRAAAPLARMGCCGGTRAAAGAAREHAPLSLPLTSHLHLHPYRTLP
jgi:hypothetical protein